MANSSYLSQGVLASLPTEIRGPLNAAFKYVLANLKLGRPNPGETLQDRGANLTLYALSTTTPSTPDEEFSIVHGLPTAPYLIVPVLPLDVAGGQIVPLTVTRPADDVRVYLSSSVADAPITVLCEV